MAEAIARAQFEGHDEDLFFGSAGVAAFDGAHPSREAVEALDSIGITLEGRSKALTPEMIKKADLILCMTEAHLATSEQMVEGDDDSLTKIHLLEADGESVPDPIGMGLEAYLTLAAHLQEVIPPRIESLLAPA